ncbi:hypothetical protein JD844_009287 [Phrynosoma platyrhinos]|uniref:BHLH domain-containing protein n=1 Tax=Phrynosoma platyrhinos TaxID=52577 RepID=A0ABQ7TF02_PHRPL|nr:hypothetical protein JD844_009287 [Phrynosoma platyrhinos]
MLAKLRDKGIHRSVPEIRNKCKTLKSDNNKVTNHNKISGNAPATCPFFNELDRFLRHDQSVFPKKITKSLHVVRQGPGGPSSQHSSSQAPEPSQQQDASTIAFVTVEVPLAMSEDDNVIIHLIPLEQLLPVETPPPEESEPQDLPSSPAASDGRILSDREKFRELLCCNCSEIRPPNGNALLTFRNFSPPETQISGEGHQEQAFQSPAGETQATGPNEVSGAPQETDVRRVPMCTVVRRVRADEEFQDRRARRGELIARIIIKDSRREGHLNRALASLARALQKDSASAAQHRRRLYSYLDRLIAAAEESVVQKCRRNDIMERHLASNNNSSTQAVESQSTCTGTQILFEDWGDEGPAPTTCLVPATEPTETVDDTQCSQSTQGVSQSRATPVPQKGKRQIKKQIYSPS